MSRTPASALVAAVLTAVLVVAQLTDHAISAPRAAARPGGVVVVAAGDIACPPGPPPTPAGCHQRATARAVLAQHPRAVLPLGDNQYRDGSLSTYRASYDRTWGRFIGRTYPTRATTSTRPPGRPGTTATSAPGPPPRSRPGTPSGSASGTWSP
jgi:hypothetical protein